MITMMCYSLQSPALPTELSRDSDERQENITLFILCAMRSINSFSQIGFRQLVFIIFYQIEVDHRSKQSYQHVGFIL